MEVGYMPAKESDIERIFEQCKSVIDKYEDLSSIDYPKVIEWVKRKLQANIANYTVVTANGETAGYYCLDKQSDNWELDDFYILPPYRGKGIGTSVLNTICKNTNGSIILYVFRENIGAISLYKRFGFEITKVVSNTRQIMERPG